MDGLEFDGLDDLVDGLENAVSKYPDLAEAGLKREQRDFKKDMIRETWSAVRAARKVHIFIWSIMVMKW